MEDGDAIPVSVKRVIEKHGIFIPEGMSEEQLEVFQFAVEGKCMTCQNPLGEATMVLLIKQGVVGLYCHPRCMSDMQVIGFLKQQHDDLTERIAFRGDIEADTAEEDEDEGND